MSLTGEIKSIYRDREQTQPVFPVTKVKAVSDDNGTGLNVLLDNIHKDIDGLTYSDVGAAPAGFGLGESVHYSETVHRMKSVEEMDEVYVCGWSFFYPEKPVILNGISVSYGVLFTTGLNNERACQELYVNNIRFKLVRWRASSGWKEWACEAPPMVSGVEYLTTERSGGYQVYAKLVDFGALPASGTLTANVFEAGTYLDNIYVVSIDGVASTSGLTQPFPVITWDNGIAAYVAYLKGSGEIEVSVKQDMSSYSATFIVKYVKA